MRINFRGGGTASRKPTAGPTTAVTPGVYRITNLLYLATLIRLEPSPPQGFQRDVDNARHRLLTVQGSLAEAVEENTGLRRELEAERIKAAAGSRRLGDAVERQEAALAQIRHESAQVRDQRDRWVMFARDCAFSLSPGSVAYVFIGKDIMIPRLIRDRK